MMRWEYPKSEIDGMVDALEDAIEVWYYKLMLAYAGLLRASDLTVHECPCCEWSEENGMGCDHCILVVGSYSRTGCGGTPFYPVHNKLTGAGGGVPEEDLVTLVIREVKFLESVYAKEIAILTN